MVLPRRESRLVSRDESIASRETRRGVKLTFERYCKVHMSAADIFCDSGCFHLLWLSLLNAFIFKFRPLKQPILGNEGQLF